MTDSPLAQYTFIKELRAGGEGKAILYEKNGIKYVCKQRVFNSINEANAGLKEAYSLARVINDNIVKFEDIFLQSNNNDVIYLCIMMEYCDHGDLLDFLIELSDNVESDAISDTSSDISENSDISERSSSSGSNDSKKNSPTNSNVSSSPSSPTPTPHKESGSTCKKLKSKCIIKMTKEFTKYIINSIHNSGHGNSSSSSSSNNVSNLSNNIPANTSSNSLSNVISAGTSSNNLLDFGGKRNSSNQLSYEVEETIQSNQIKGEANSIYLIEQTQLLEWMLQLCYGVQSLHKSQLIHRDLKSENIFISKANKLKIGDFGLAVKSSTPSIGIVGTYIYSAPEVLEGKTYDKSADIFSLGCIFYELITLKLLLKHKYYIAEEQINDRFCAMKFLSSFPNKYYKLGPLVLKMVDKNPTLRPSIEYIIDKLQSLDHGGVVKSLSTQSLVSNSGQQPHTFKGVRKQLDKNHMQECAKVMAQGFRYDPRYAALFPPNEASSAKHLETLFSFTLKKMLKNGGTIWGYFGLDNKLLSSAILFNPDKKKGIKFSDVLVGSIKLFAKFGWKKTTLGGELFGFIDKVLTSSNNEKHWFLCSIATLDAHQNHGIGSYLLEPVLEWADHTSITCKTLTFSKKNFPFLNRLGFEVESDITTNLPKGITGAWILKRLPKRKGSELNLVNLAASVSNTNNLF